MWCHHPRPQHIRGEPESLAGVDNRAEIGLFWWLQLQWPRMCFSLVRPVVQTVFELTQSAVIWKKNAFPDRS